MKWSGAASGNLRKGTSGAGKEQLEDKGKVKEGMRGRGEAGE